MVNCEHWSSKTNRIGPRAASSEMIKKKTIHGDIRNRDLLIQTLSTPAKAKYANVIVVKRTTTVLRGLTPFFEILFYISM